MLCPQNMLCCVPCSLEAFLLFLFLSSGLSLSHGLETAAPKQWKEIYFPLQRLRVFRGFFIIVFAAVVFFFTKLIDCRNEWIPEIGWSGGMGPVAGFKVLVGFEPS